MQREGARRLDPAVYKVAAVATLGSLVAQIDATVVNVSLGTLSQQLNAPLSLIQWVTSGYLLALTFVCLSMAGWLQGWAPEISISFASFFSPSRPSCAVQLGPPDR